MTTSQSASTASAAARLEAHAAVHRWIEDALYAVLEALVARDVGGAAARFTRMRAFLEEHMAWEEAHVIPRYAPLAPKDGPGRLDHIAGDHTILIRNCDIAAGAIAALAAAPPSLREVLEQLPHVYRLIAALEHHTLREQNNVYGKIDDAGDEVDVVTALKALVERAAST